MEFLRGKFDAIVWFPFSILTDMTRNGFAVRSSSASPVNLPSSVPDARCGLTVIAA
jgi:hypothetical protein